MTTQLDFPTIFVYINPDENLVRLTDKTTGAAQAMSIEEFQKLLHLGTRIKLSAL